VCMCARICIGTVCIYVCVYVYACVCEYACMYIYLYVCIYVCMCVYMRVGVHVCVNGYTCICVYICVYTCICVYICGGITENHRGFMSLLKLHWILQRRENGRNVTSFRTWPLWPATWVGYELGGSAPHQCR